MKKILGFLILFCFSFCFGFLILNLYSDVIWNYGFAYNIVNGLIPYRDFNMIVTPAYPFILAFFIKIFGHHLYVMYFFNSFLLSIMVLLIFSKIGKKMFLILPFIFLYSFPGYNFFSLFLIFLILYLIDKKFNYDNLILGFLLSLLFLTKQSIGLCVLIPYLYYSKNKFKSLVSFLIPIIIFLIYLVYNDALYNFIDYCFLGMFDFTSHNRTVLFLPFEIIVIIILIYKLWKSNFKDKMIFYILMFQIVTIPICDDYHFMIGFIPVLYLFLNKVEISKYKFKYYFLAIYIICIYSFLLFNDFSDFHLYSDKNSYLYGRYVEEYIQESITNISNYMEDVKDEYDNVFLLTGNAYEIKLNTTYDINKFDLINNGNFGHKGYLSYIDEFDKICEEESCLFILYMFEIREDNSKYTQSSLNIINYVYKNYNKVDEVDAFYILSN